MYPGIDVCPMPWQKGDDPVELLAEGDVTVLPVSLQHQDRFRSLFGLHTCTSYAKALLGIRAPFVITPYQLYSYMQAKMNRQ